MNPIINEDFVTWARDREQARLAKEGCRCLPPADPIFQKYRFCNVSREDDRTTKWIDLNIRKPFNWGTTPEIQLQVIVLARLINLPSTLELFIDRGGITLEVGIDRKRCLELVAHLRKTDRPVFSMAYRCAPGPAGHAGGKIGYVLDTALQVKKVPTAKSRRLFAHALTIHGGIGDFLAGQIVADAAHTRLLEDAPDAMTWAPFGPGALAGANHAVGRSMGAKMSEDEYLSIGRRQHEMLAGVIPSSTWARLTLHDVASNVNCETSKYVRIRNGLFSSRRYGR